MKSLFSAVVAMSIVGAAATICGPAEAHVSVGVGIGIGVPLYPGYGYYGYPGYRGPRYEPEIVVVQPTPVPAAPRAADPIFYPKTGQTAAQTESDRQDCNRWATGQAAAMADASAFQRATYACMAGRATPSDSPAEGARRLPASPAAVSVQRKNRMDHNAFLVWWLLAVPVVLAIVDLVTGGRTTFAAGTADSYIARMDGRDPLPTMATAARRA